MNNNKTAVCAVFSVPIESLPYKYNEAEESVILMKSNLSALFQRLSVDTDLTVMTNGEFGVPLWSLEIIHAARILGCDIKTVLVSPHIRQEMCWAEEWRERLYKVVEKIDSAPILPDEYTELCETMQDYYCAADDYMRDNCDFFIVVTVDGEEPYTAGMARDSGKPVIYFDAVTCDVTQEEP